MRVNIYVGDDLKKRMDKLKEPVNWSQVACLAFEAKLGEIAASKRDKNMQDVIQRLKASKNETLNAEDAAGKAAGEKWARDVASFPQLKAMAKIDAELREEGNGFLDRFSEDNAWREMPEAIGEEFNDNGNECLAYFWHLDAAPSGDYVAAFFEAAVQVFSDIEDKL